MPRRADRVPPSNGVVPHVGGPIVSPGCPTVLIGSLPAARVTDIATWSNVLGGTFSFAWQWIRGGNLTIAARANVGGNLTEAIFMGTITGTDPTISDIRKQLGDDTMRRIANVESGFHQFEADPGTGKILPKFNFKRNAKAEIKRRKWWT